ncbi:MAG TPA: hypothetical protein VIE64_03900 [Solirubrobacterales bacterium]|jgi:hypothetical protein
MLERVTGDDVFAEIQMMRTVETRTVLLLESGADCGALDPHIDDTTARTIPTYSKTALVRAMTLVTERSVGRVAGLADRDFEGLLEVEEESIAGLFYTDLYDLDATIMLGGDILDRLLASFADRSKLSAYLSKFGCTSRELLIRLVSPVGIARLVSVRDRLEVRLENFPVHTCTRATEGDLDISEMCDVAISRSKQPTCGRSEFVSKVRSELAGSPDLERLCSGHDLAAEISHLIRTEWGQARVSGDLIERAARAAFDCENLKATAFYAAISQWAISLGDSVWECT